MVTIDPGENKFGAPCLEVNFVDVPEFGSGGSNTFTTVFDETGRISFYYDDLTETGGLVGITEGNGAADPGESDVGGSTFSEVGTTYEFFSDFGDNDLAGDRVKFKGGTTCN